MVTITKISAATKGMLRRNRKGQPHEAAGNDKNDAHILDLTNSKTKNSSDEPRGSHYSRIDKEADHPRKTGTVDETALARRKGKARERTKNESVRALDHTDVGEPFEERMRRRLRKTSAGVDDGLKAEAKEASRGDQISLNETSEYAVEEPILLDLVRAVGKSLRLQEDDNHPKAKAKGAQGKDSTSPFEKRMRRRLQEADEGSDKNGLKATTERTSLTNTASSHSTSTAVGSEATYEVLAGHGDDNSPDAKKKWASPESETSPHRRISATTDDLKADPKEVSRQKTTQKREYNNNDRATTFVTMSNANQNSVDAKSYSEEVVKRLSRGVLMQQEQLKMQGEIILQLTSKLKVLGGSEREDVDCTADSCLKANIAASDHSQALDSKMCDEEVVKRLSVGVLMQNNQLKARTDSMIHHLNSELEVVRQNMNRNGEDLLMKKVSEEDRQNGNKSKMLSEKDTERQAINQGDVSNDARESSEEGHGDKQGTEQGKRDGQVAATCLLQETAHRVEAACQHVEEMATTEEAKSVLRAAFAPLRAKHLQRNTSLLAQDKVGADKSAAGSTRSGEGSAETTGKTGPPPTTHLPA